MSIVMLCKSNSIIHEMSIFIWFLAFKNFSHIPDDFSPVRNVETPEIKQGNETFVFLKTDLLWIQQICSLYLLQVKPHTLGLFVLWPGTFTVCKFRRFWDSTHILNQRLRVKTGWCPAGGLETRSYAHGLCSRPVLPRRNCRWTT